jgi:hypothetical protein
MQKTSMQSDAPPSDWDILQFLLREAHRSQILSVAAIQEYEQFIARVNEDGLTFEIPLEEVDETMEDRLRMLKKEGFINKELRYSPLHGHHFYISLKTIWFDNLQNNPTLMPSTEKQERFSTGAVRDSQEGKPRPELISPFAIERLAEWLRKGAEKYTPRNWEFGIPLGRSTASLWRHLLKFQMGCTDEDHVAAILCNAMFIAHTQEMIQRGILPESLDDLPKYNKSSEQ